MNFTYSYDALGDKLVSGKFVIRPVIEEKTYCTPSTFELHDFYSLYLIEDNLEMCKEDFDSIREAIAAAESGRY